MSFSHRRRVYEELPDFFKRGVGWVPFAWMAGKHYRRVLGQGSRIDRMSREDVRQLQEERLGQLLVFACDQVPAYRPLRPIVERLRPMEALKAFPFVDKKQVQERFPDYVPRDIERIAHWECTTGGTSGNQLRFFLDDKSPAIENAFIHRLWARVGYTTRSRKATFRGTTFPDLEGQVYWKPNPIYRELLFSPFHMGPTTLGRYVDQLLRFRPEFLHGYPSAIQLLAEHVLRERIALDELRLKAVLLASEAPVPGQREVLEAAFGCRVFSWYGHSERVILGGECERTSTYHQFPDYGILEVVDERGNAVEEEGGRGELVGTGLNNESMPLIRYRTEDWAVRRDHRCSCGRAFDRFDQVEGRWLQEYVIGRSGSRISPSALNLHGPVLEHVLRYQYHQREAGVMEVRLMVSDAFSNVDLEQLTRAFADRVGSELEIRPRIVSEIALTPRGKLPRLIQEIPAGPAGARSQPDGR
jgi:phenylacetate-CoA ligase